MYPSPIEKLINLFSEFPTVGPRTAARFVFYLIRLPKEEIDALVESISEIRTKIKFCSLCFNVSGNDLCDICSDHGRNRSLLCVIEKETDLETIEKTKKYKGLYFILGGAVSRLCEEDIKKLRTKELLERIKFPEIQEIIIATNPTTEGEATALYLERLLKPLGKKTTRLGRGLPIGGELEYADEETLSSALDNRR